MLRITASHSAASELPLILPSNPPAVTSPASPSQLTLSAWTRDGDSWRRVDCDLYAFPHIAATIRAGIFSVRILVADPFSNGCGFDYLAQLECVAADFVLCRNWLELLDLISQLKGLE